MPAVASVGKASSCLALAVGVAVALVLGGGHWWRRSDSGAGGYSPNLCLSWAVCALLLGLMLTPLDSMGGALIRLGSWKRAATHMAPHTHVLLWHAPALWAHRGKLLAHAEALAPHMGELVAADAPLLRLRHLERVVPQLELLLPHIGQLAPRLPELAPYLDSLLPLLPQLAPHLGQLTPFLDGVSGCCRRCLPSVGALAQQALGGAERGGLMRGDAWWPQLIRDMPRLLPLLPHLQGALDVVAPRLADLLPFQSELLDVGLGSMLEGLEPVGPLFVRCCLRGPCSTALPLCPRQFCARNSWRGGRRRVTGSVLQVLLRRHAEALVDHLPALLPHLPAITAELPRLQPHLPQVPCARLAQHPPTAPPTQRPLLAADTPTPRY
jgi:hypothetical protein